MLAHKEHFDTLVKSYPNQHFYEIFKDLKKTSLKPDMTPKFPFIDAKSMENPIFETSTKKQAIIPTKVLEKRENKKISPTKPIFNNKFGEEIDFKNINFFNDNNGKPKNTNEKKAISPKKSIFNEEYYRNLRENYAKQIELMAQINQANQAYQVSQAQQAYQMSQMSQYNQNFSMNHNMFPINPMNPYTPVHQMMAYNQYNQFNSYNYGMMNPSMCMPPNQFTMDHAMPTALFSESASASAAVVHNEPSLSISSLPVKFNEVNIHNDNPDSNSWME
jgi:hypothetical protein